MAAESVCAKRLRYGEKTPTQKVLPARTWHMRTDFELARLASFDQCRLSSNAATAMPRRELELPPEVARAFVRDMHAFFAVGGTGIKADEIAIRQLVILNEYLGRRERPLRVIDVKEMFLQMRDQA